MGFAEDVMQILHMNNRGPHLDVSEKLYVYRETKKATQINDKHIDIWPHCNVMKLLHNTHPAWHPTVRPCCTQI